MLSNDQVVLVTGAGSGIGKAVALRAAREGAAVAVLDQSSDAVSATTSEVQATGGRAHGVTADVGDEEQVAAAVASSVEALGRVSGVVTSAGIFAGGDLSPAHLVALDDFMHVLRVNLVGTFLTVKHTLPHLVDGGGAIVTIASTAALRGHGFGSGYTASKGGVDALTRLLAVQYGPHGVRANCVCPGGVDTPLTGGAFATDEARERARRSIPLGRYAEARDIADVVAFLLSDDARYVTGQTFPVEGGALVS
jgi:NAD(P)-dependent dehydrogenase (short-subunit alcohol dehydrogenase family)